MSWIVQRKNFHERKKKEYAARRDMMWNWPIKAFVLSTRWNNIMQQLPKSPPSEVEKQLLLSHIENFKLFFKINYSKLYLIHSVLNEKYPQLFHFHPWSYDTWNVFRLINLLVKDSALTSSWVIKMWFIVSKSIHWRT